MPIYGEYVPPSPAIGRALASGAAGAVAFWTAQLGLGIAPTTTLNLLDGTQAGLQLHDGSTTPVGDAGTARLRYNAGSLEVSLNGAAYMPLGGGSLDAAYDFGGPGAGRTITVDSDAVTLNQDGVASVLFYSLLLLNNSPSTVGVPVQNSGGVGFNGHAWSSTAGVDMVSHSAIYEAPESATVARSVLAFSKRRVAGAFTKLMRLSDGLGTAGFGLSVDTGLNSTVPAFQVKGQAGNEDQFSVNFYAAAFHPQGINSIRCISTNAFRGTDPIYNGAGNGTIKALDFGYGYNVNGVLGYDTFSPTNAANRYHSRFNSVYSPNAPGLAANFAAVQINPQFSGDSGSGIVTALAVALKTSITTTGQVNIIDFGTTGTDYFTGYTSNLKLIYASANDVRLRTTSGQINLLELYVGAVNVMYVGSLNATTVYTQALGSGVTHYVASQKELILSSSGTVAVGGTTIQRTVGAVGKQVLKVTGPADTSKTLSTEAYDVYFNLNRTVEWATGALATQRAVYIEAPTYAFVGASTITDASTFAVGGQPILGTNTTYINSWAGYFGGSVNIVRPSMTGSSSRQAANSILKVSGGADVNRVGVEYIDVHFDLARVVTFNNLDHATQRAVCVAAPTYNFNNPTNTFTNASTFAVDGQPIPGVNAIVVNSWAGWFGGSVNIVRPAITVVGTTNPIFQLSGGADTNRAATVEHTDVNINLARTVTWATGNITNQRAFAIYAPTYSAPAPSAITFGATVYIDRAPQVAGSMSFGWNYALWVDAGDVRIDGNLVGYTDGIKITRAILAGASTPYLKVIGTADTARTLSTECHDVHFDIGRTVEWATGALATQRAVYIEAPTYAFVGASTITDAATFYIDGAPAAGANATITNAYAIWVDSGATRLDGDLYLDAMTQGSVFFSGASGLVSEDNDKLFFDATNYRLGVGLAAPLYTVDVTHPAIATGVNHGLLRVVGAADTNRTLSTQVHDVSFDFGRTVQWATGALALQVAFAVYNPTYDFVGASTITLASTMMIFGAPVPGGEATITDSYALYVYEPLRNGIAIEGAFGTAHAHALTLIESDIEVMPGIAWRAGAGLVHSNGPSQAPNAEKGSGVCFMRSNGVASPGERTQFCVMWEDNSVTVVAEGPAS